MLDRRHVVLVLIAPGVVVAAASTAIEGRMPAENVRPGRAEYVEMGCHQCHGYEGQGSRLTGPRIAPEPLAIDVFSTWVRRPPEDMPAYSPKVLSEDKLERIYDYMLSIPPPPDVSTLPALSED